MIRCVPSLSVLLAALTLLSADAAEPSEALKALRTERREIQRAIRKAVPDPNEKDPELAKLQRESIDAMKAYEAAIDAHPNLTKFRAESNEATRRLTEAIAKKDDQARNEAQEAISALMHQRMEAAAQEPELQPLAKANDEAGRRYFEKRDEVLARLPETKDLAARLAEVNARIQEEMKRGR